MEAVRMISEIVQDFNGQILRYQFSTIPNINEIQSDLLQCLTSIYMHIYAQFFSIIATKWKNYIYAQFNLYRKSRN